MRHNNLSRPAAALSAFAAALLLLLPAPARAQRREHLTPQEIEIIRDTQELDKRTAAFVRAAERRLLALADPAAAAKRDEKDAAKWGEAKGTRTQLLYDVAKILEEAVVNIDDVSERTPQSPLLKKSLHKLAGAVGGFMPQLTAMREAAGDAREREMVEKVIEQSQEILEAAARHPPDEKGSEKSGKKPATKN